MTLTDYPLQPPREPSGQARPYSGIRAPFTAAAAGDARNAMRLGDLLRGRPGGVLRRGRRLTLVVGIELADDARGWP